ncbi:MAG TPA: methionyl-tRNA formyltransferase [Bacteroidota bacterium]|nr:methionyl-tRNA formyltransferase [Bacteroidota bacterium]
MNIVFMGTPEFAVPSLEILLKNNFHVGVVVTAPDKPRGRGQQVSFTPVKDSALKHSLPILQPDSLSDPAFIASLRSYNPSLIVVVAFRILPVEVFALPPMGTFNLHASLLPKYRGAAPINWAIINGEKESGVTTFYLKEKVDTGDVILQARVAIPGTMTAGELHDTLSEVGAEIVLQTVRLIEMGKTAPHPQDQARSTPAPKIFKNDCRIDWKKPAGVVHNFIRGLSPSPTAWTMHRGTLLKVYKSIESEIEDRKLAPGYVVVEGSKLLITTGNGSVAILEIQQEGKRRMTAEEFLRGYKIVSGDVVE